MINIYPLQYTQILSYTYLQYPLISRPMINYQKLLQQESNALRELNQIEELIYQNNSNLDLNEHMLQYPHLFHNQDSLFLPDALYASKGLCRKSFDNLHDDNPIERNNFNKNNQLKDKSDGGKKQQQIFAQYLDSLEINQFLEIQNCFKVKQKLKATNSQKTLESSLECTFKPSILKKSSQIAVNLKPSFQRLTMPVRNNPGGNKKIPYKPANAQYNKQYSKQRIQRLSKPRILKTQPCEPIEYQRPSEVQKKYSVQRSSNYLDVAARNQLWQEQKRIKLQKMRKQEQENKIRKQASTFVPKITEYRGQKGVNLSNFGKEGMVNYFQRLNMAKVKNLPNFGKQNSNNGYGRKNSSNSPYCSNSNINEQNFASKTPTKQKNREVNSNKGANKGKDTNPDIKGSKKKIKYDEAVKQLHRKLMSLNI